MEWTAEAHVTEELAARLVAGQFPPLPRRSLALLGKGWDYAVYRVDETWTFRFPRRAVVVPGTEREIAVLGRLAPLLAVPVPAPVHVGRPTDAFPWPFYGARFLPGTEAGEAALTDADRVRLARPLAQALRSLHAPATLAAVGGLLPVDGNRRADMEVRVPRTREALDAVAALGVWKAPAETDEILDRAARLPPSQPTAVCHGDLHFRQLLVDGGGLAGVLDWVDLCRSDPGVDLQLVWSFLPAGGRAAFLDEYGPVTDDSLLRARVLALFLNAVLARYGRAEGLTRVEAEAVASLDRTLHP